MARLTQKFAPIADQVLAGQKQASPPGDDAGGDQAGSAGFTGLAEQWASVVDHALKVWTTSLSACWQSKAADAPSDNADPVTAWNDYLRELAYFFGGWVHLYGVGGSSSTATTATTATTTASAVKAKFVPGPDDPQTTWVKRTGGNQALKLEGDLVNSNVETIPAARVRLSPNAFDGGAPDTLMRVDVSVDLSNYHPVTAGPYYGRLLVNPSVVGYGPFPILVYVL
jgi:hypothetical protein